MGGEGPRSGVLVSWVRVQVMGTLEHAWAPQMESTGTVRLLWPLPTAVGVDSWAG